MILIQLNIYLELSECYESLQNPTDSASYPNTLHITLVIYILERDVIILSSNILE